MQKWKTENFATPNNSTMKIKVTEFYYNDERVL
jgi:hypothetical protein